MDQHTPQGDINKTFLLMAVIGLRKGQRKREEERGREREEKREEARKGEEN